MPGFSVGRRKVWEGSDFDLIARVVGRDQGVLLQSDYAAGGIDFHVYEHGDPTAKFSVTGISVSGGQPSGSAGSTSGNVIFDTLQTDGRWDADSTGYNFRYAVRAIDLAQTDSFALEGGRTYKMEFRHYTTDWGIIPVVWEIETAQTYTV